MKTVRRIELLAPAKNVEIGQQAILHGADAVYIGAPRFGARSEERRVGKECRSRWSPYH